MAVTREYIGSRYVPIFGRKGEESIVWDNSKPYEPLTVVLYQGNSYTSRQYVPVGVDIDNESFWAETGNYNAQVEQYRQEVLQFSNDIVNKAFAFDTVADMKTFEGLYEGAICHTNGFHESEDGGAAYYLITVDGEDNGMDVIQLDNGLFAKLKITSNCVTPEMFGAYGDGEHDDSAAWQQAVSKCNRVFAASNIYKCGNIEITNDSMIDCNNASFICNSTNLFNCSGEVVTSLEGEQNYAARSSTYSIIDSSYRGYSGVAVLKGTNNVEPSRTYYLGGFVCEFANGKITESYPIPVENTVIDIINPIHVEISNIGNAQHVTHSNSNVMIRISYGENCKLSNICADNANSYEFIEFDYCIGCIADNLNISNRFESSDNNSYVIYFKNSSFCKLNNSTLYNTHWHCGTTGGRYLCYCNRIDNCSLITGEKAGYFDHENTLGTYITNTVATSLGVSGMSLIDGCIIKINTIDAQTGKGMCNIRLTPAAIERNAMYTVKNVQLVADTETVIESDCGIKIASSPQEPGGTYYIRNICIDNVTTIGTASPRFWLSVPDTDFYVLKRIEIRSSYLSYRAGVSSSMSSVIDISDNTIVLVDINDRIGSWYLPFGLKDYNFGNLFISNCRLQYLRGNFASLSLSDFECKTQITSTDTSATSISGSNLMSAIDSSVIAGATNVNISNMFVSNSIKWFNIGNDIHGKKWYQTIDDGTVVITEITS